jgi:hypothetical protein
LKGRQFHLTNAVNGNALRDPLVDKVNHAVDLAVAGGVKVVVVDVQFGVGVGGTRRLESNLDKLLSEDTREDGVSESTVLSKDLVQNVLGFMLTTDKKTVHRHVLGHNAELRTQWRILPA